MRSFNMAIAYTQEKINEVTNLIYTNYYNHFKNGRMSFADITLVENVIIKVQNGFDDNE